MKHTIDMRRVFDVLFGYITRQGFYITFFGFCNSTKPNALRVIFENVLRLVRCLDLADLIL
jgi:hypothetical protein